MKITIEVSSGCGLRIAATRVLDYLQFELSPVDANAIIEQLAIDVESEIEKQRQAEIQENRKQHQPSKQWLEAFSTKIDPGWIP